MIEADVIAARLGPVPIRGRERWLADSLGTLLIQGVLGADQALPGARRLAAELGMARGTVVRALDALIDQGLLVARVGQPHRTGPSRGAATQLNRIESAARPDHSPGVGDLSMFPRTAWTRAMRKAISEVTDVDLGYPAAQGEASLRRALATRLARVRGADVDPERVVIVAGAAQGMAVLHHAVARQGIRDWFVEAPSPAGLAQVLEHHGASITRLAVDELGAVLPTSTRPAMLLLTPSRQAPTGVPLAPQRRAEVMGLTEQGCLVVEDDYDGDLPAARDRVTVLQAASPHSTFLLGSVSKTLAPGLRLGWIVAPRPWVEAIVAEREFFDLGSPVLDQRGLANLLESGDYDRHLRRLRPIYAERRGALVSALDSRGIATMGVPGPGLHVFVPMPAGAAERIRVGLTDANVPVAVTTGPPSGLSLGCANLPVRRAGEVAEAIAVVASQPRQ